MNTKDAGVRAVGAVIKLVRVFARPFSVVEEREKPLQQASITHYGTSQGRRMAVPPSHPRRRQY